MNSVTENEILNINLEINVNNETNLALAALKLFEDLKPFVENPKTEIDFGPELTSIINRQLAFLPDNALEKILPAYPAESAWWAFCYFNDAVKDYYHSLDIWIATHHITVTSKLFKEVMKDANLNNFIDFRIQLPNLKFVKECRFEFINLGDGLVYFFETDFPELFSEVKEQVKERIRLMEEFQGEEQIATPWWQFW